MRFAARLTLGLLAVAAVGIALGTYQLTLIDRLVADGRRLANDHLAAATTALAARGHLDEAVQLTRRLEILRDPAYAGRLQRLREEVVTLSRRLETLRLSPDERNAASRLRGRIADYLEIADAAEADVVAGRTVAAERIQDILSAAIQAADDLSVAADEAAEKRIRASTSRGQRSRRIAWIAAALATLTALALALVLIRTLARPVRELSDAAAAIGSGDFGARAPTGHVPELAELGAEFNAMADRLAELDRSKQDFLSSVSHDLKAPLASMIETSALLLEEVPGPLTDDQRRLIELTVQSGRRLQGMIGDLLDLSRLEGALQPIPEEVVDLVEIVRRSVAEADGLLQPRGLRIDLRLPAEPMTTVGDPDLIARAVWNLLANAVRFSPDGGTVEVEAIGPIGPGDAASRFSAPLLPPGAGRIHCLVIADSGPGVDPGERERIFERFYRGAGSKRSAGTGLGLAVVRSVATAHRGTAWVEPRRAGDGSRFVMAFPAESP